MKGLFVLSIISLSLFFLLGVFLLSEGLRRKSGYSWLGIFFILLSLNSLDASLIFNGFYFDYPDFILWEDPFVLLYGPLVYYFGRQLSGSLKTLDIVHIVPFLLLEFGVVYFHLTSSADLKIEILNKVVQSQMDIPTLVGFGFIFIHLFLYLVTTKRTLRNYESDIRKYYSTQEVKWSVDFINFILVIFSASALTSLLRLLSYKLIQLGVLIGSITLTIVWTLRVLTKAMRQPVFKPIITVDNSKMEDEDVAQLKALIEDYITTNKPFTKPDFTIKELSTAINESERSVSKVINQSLGENFYDYINGHRINEAKYIFDQNQDKGLTVLEVLYQVGFNSKSSFNTQFKKKTGLTPTEYRKQAN